MPDAAAGLSGAGLSGAGGGACPIAGSGADKKPRITIKQPSAFNDLVRKEFKIARATQKNSTNARKKRQTRQRGKRHVYHYGPQPARLRAENSG